MVRRIVQHMVLLILLAVVVAPVFAQGASRMWYRGPWDGWVEVKNTPAPGYYYHPSPSLYPLNEAAWGQPIPCQWCGHSHYPGLDVCPYCGQKCNKSGNGENPRTVYSPYQLPGQYWLKEQPHFRFASPMRLGPYQKYAQPYD